MVNSAAKIFLVFLGLLAVSVQAADLKITASTWPPYADKRLYANGFALALVKAALERAGYKTSVQIVGWPESLEATQRGDYDVFATVWHTPERAETLTFSEPYIDNHIKFVKRSDSGIIFNKPEDLDGLRIGLVADFAYRARAYEGVDIEVASSGSVLENLQGLLDGELDLVAADERVALYEINKQFTKGAARMTVLPESALTRGLRIAISKKNPDHEQIAADFDRAFAAMKEDGTYFDILAQHRISVD